MSPDRLTLAHGIGGGEDLPISPELAIAGAVAALTVSFTVLAVAWRAPRYESGRSGRPLPGLARVVESTGFRVAARTFGMVLFLYTAMVGVFGEDLLINPIVGIFYVWLWIGLVPLSLLLGPFWRAISPVRTINALLARLSGSDPDQGLLTYPERLGVWPAVLGLYAFVWMELLYPHSTQLGPIRLWLAAYVAVMLLGGALFGNRFYERADPFEVFSSLVASMSPWGRRDGQLVLRSPLANLATVPARPGLLAVVAVLFGSTAFDSFLHSPPWVRLLQGSEFVRTHDWATEAANNLALLTFCLGAGLVFWLGCVSTGVGPGQRRLDLPNAFAHSVVPIIVGYFVAHYLTFFIDWGQRTLIYASDPFSDGSDYLGTADLVPWDWLSYHPSLLATIKVAAVVVGHVLGVVAAHDRAVAVLPKRHQLTGQLPLLFAMVAFTVGGLYLLFAA